LEVKLEATIGKKREPEKRAERKLDKKITSKTVNE